MHPRKRPKSLVSTKDIQRCRNSEGPDYDYYYTPMYYYQVKESNGTAMLLPRARR